MDVRRQSEARDLAVYEVKRKLDGLERAKVVEKPQSIEPVVGCQSPPIYSRHTQNFGGRMKGTLALPVVAALLLLPACADDTVSGPLLSAPGAVVAIRSANAGLTLHPSGFGQDSYAAWRAQEGIQDSRGNANMALYFQKMTATATFAAGFAVIEGVDGIRSEQLGLAWDHREDGHCGAGAPRWNVTLEDPITGTRSTVFLGCYAAAHTQLAPSSGHGWCKDTQPSLPSGFIVRRLAIVFDEGNDTPNPPPVGCGQEQLAGGFVYLDNITVTVNGVANVFTSPADNGTN